MVDILDTEQIDALFMEIDPDGSKYDTREGGRSKAPAGPVKIHRIPKKVVPRSYNPYRSPVVKAGSIVLNPDDDVDAGPQHTVVRTVENYAQYRRQRQDETVKEGPAQIRMQPAVLILRENT